jgi:hypothetical protein
VTVQFVAVWLALVLAHLVGDFVLQRTAVVRGKAVGSKLAYAEHGAVHLVCLVFSFIFFVGPEALAGSKLVVLAGLVVVHLGLDVAKETTNAGAPHGPRRWPFLVDQALHFVLITVAAALLAPLPSKTALEAGWWGVSNIALVLAVGYTAVVFAAGYVNAVLLQPFSSQLGRWADDDDNGANGRGGGSVGLARAGMSIGILERFLIMTAVLAGSPTGVGLVIAAKSVFRFEDAKKGRHAAEYFLIGTFLSVSEAVIGGVVVGRLLAFFG